MSQVTGRKESLHRKLKSHDGVYIQSKPVVHTVILEMDETAAMILHNLFIFYFPLPNEGGVHFYLICPLCFIF